MLVPYTFFVLSLFLHSSFVFALLVPPNDGFVTDTVGILNEQEEGELESLLGSYQAQTSNEVAVLIVGSLHGEPIADTAIAIGREWGIGGEENDNGLLLLVAYEDREIFLATGYGLEGAIPDIVAKGIVEEDILPRFRDGAYAQGIRAGLDAIIKHIGGEYTVERYATSDATGGSRVSLFFIGIVMLFLVSFALMIVRGFFGSIFGLFFGWILSIPLFIILGCVIDFLASFLYRRLPRMQQWVHGQRMRRRTRRGRWWFFGGGGGGRGGGFGGFGGGSFGGGGGGGG